MKITDLSHRFGVGDLVFPGTNRMSMDRTHTTEKDGYNLTMVTVNTHAGTHTDAPFHFEEDGKRLADVEIQKYVGACFVVDCRAKGYANAFIDVEDVLPYEEQIRKAGKVIFCTGWDVHYNEEIFFTEYPGITEELAQWLVDLGVDMVGVEGPSMSTKSGPQVHHILLRNNVAIVESLANLGGLVGREILLCAAPIAVDGMDGFPIRAYAIEL